MSPVFSFEAKHPKHGVAYYGITSAESPAAAKRHLEQRAAEREQAQREINEDDTDETRTVIEADKLTFSVKEVK